MKGLKLTSQIEPKFRFYYGVNLRSLKITSNGFEIEKKGCVFYEVPISYYAWAYAEGKKVKVFDGVKSTFYIFYFSLITFFSRGDINEK